MTMSLFSTLTHIESHIPQSFVAPILDAHTTCVHVVQAGIPYRFDVRGVEPGWYELQPIDKHTASGAPAQPYQYLPYLQHLPRIYVIACFRLSAHTWLVVPYNPSDARQRGWPNAEPRQLHLVRGSIAPLDVCDTRMLAGTLLYSNTKRLEVGTGLATARDIIQSRAAEMEREVRRQTLAAQQATLENRVRAQVEFVGAELVDFSEFGESLRVTWEYNGYRHTASIGRDLELQSAGMCLGDYREQWDWHNLTTTILAIEQGRELHRFDMEREAWL